MLKGKQKKLDVNKDGKISGEDFAMLKNVRMQKKDAMGKKVVKAEKGKMVNGTGKYIDLPENLLSLSGASEKELKLFKEYSKSIGKFSKKKMGGGMIREPIMANEGEFVKRRMKLAGPDSLKDLFKVTGFKMTKPDLSTPSGFLKRNLLGKTKDTVSGVLGRTPIGRVAKVVGAGLGVGAAAKGVSDLKDDKSFEEGKEEGKKEGSSFKERAKKEIGKALGRAEGVLSKRTGGYIRGGRKEIKGLRAAKLF